ncbi:MAG: adenylosuccinate lyase [Planctomyces sp.]|nr:adenylosuccinate lyase [Planctomyces sp.]MBA4039567.1 adenylosuccinate lyase [Planctomyces sp.]
MIAPRAKRAARGPRAGSQGACVSEHDVYQSPLVSRSASAAMARLWSARHKFNAWRRVWLAVAQAQHALGLPVSAEQVAALRAVVERPGGISDEEIRQAGAHERRLRHDVMAHVHALGDACPAARGVIHLGMTSQDVVCNADAMIIGQALSLVRAKVARLVITLARRGVEFKGEPTLGFTHYQPAQPVTVGRRLAQWGHDLWLCLLRLEALGWPSPLARVRGLRGATGTQASFLSLLDGRSGSVDALEGRWLAALWGGPTDPSERTLALTGQTYPRVLDTFVLADLASAASVLHKIATDVRLLCNRKELDEPFEAEQVGSSAMPYKRNPMRCERACGLARAVMNQVGNAYDTAATQWLERTLDDSSNRRLSLPEAFLALDGALDLVHSVAEGLVVHRATVRRNLMAELPFMAAENALMACVRLGGDRQEYHERIRVHAQAAGTRVKDQGLDNDLLQRLRADPAFGPPALRGPLDWDGVLDPMAYVGRSVEQTERFEERIARQLQAQYGAEIAELGDTAPRL